jgi:hypothetical protein
VTAVLNADTQKDYMTDGDHTPLVRLDNAHTYRYGFRWRYPCIPRFSLEEWQRSAELPQLFDQHERIIVTHANDPIDRSTHLAFERLTEQLGVRDRITILTSDSLMRDHDANTVWWPSAVDLLATHYRDRELPDPGPRPYRLGCVNGMPRPHRFLALHMLEQRGLDQDGVIVCHGLRHLYQDLLMPPDHVWFRELPAEVRARLMSDAYQRHYPGSSWQLDQHGVTHDAFSRCALNLVTETDVGPHLCHTEKSIKPMLAGQLWITIGPPHINRVLSDLGFECFDPDIPHATYDHIECWTQRLTQAIDLLAKIWHQIPDIHQRARSGLEHNQRHVISDQFRDLIRQGLRDHDLIQES